MSIEEQRIISYGKNIKDLADRPALTAAELKAMFDGRTDEEVKASINGIIDGLLKESAAGEIGAKDGGLTTTVQAFLNDLRSGKVSSDDIKKIKVGREGSFLDREGGPVAEGLCGGGAHFAEGWGGFHRLGQQSVGLHKRPSQEDHPGI